MAPIRIAAPSDGTVGRCERIVSVHDDVVRRRVRVEGRVQGVFFRDSARQRAAAHGVSGWIANRHDGTVEAVLEGSPEAVERVLRFLQTGPREARVDHVDVEDEPPEGLSSFEVR